MTRRAGYTAGSFAREGSNAAAQVMEMLIGLCGQRKRKKVSYFFLPREGAAPLQHFLA